MAKVIDFWKEKTERAQKALDVELRYRDEFIAPCDIEIYEDGDLVGSFTIECGSGDVA